jgi:Gluconate 2-dehydrogenase subunit 3
VTAQSGAQAAGGGRFPSFDPVDQSSHWDPVTAGVVLARLAAPASFRFFTPGEQAAATALCDRLLDQSAGTRVPVAQLIDSRLAEQETDGWRYDDMPEDGQAWRDCLGFLDEDAQAKYGCSFADCGEPDQCELIQAVQDAGSGGWHGLNAAHVWSLWTRYVCTAFYAHPAAWAEIGFPGPAYPRGYKNAGVDKREPFEIRDRVPSDDPVGRAD